MLLPLQGSVCNWFWTTVMQDSFYWLLSARWMVSFHCSHAVGVKWSMNGEIVRLILGWIGWMVYPLWHRIDGLVSFRCSHAVGLGQSVNGEIVRLILSWIVWIVYSLM
jgi:hypothetical protein